MDDIEIIEVGIPSPTPTVIEVSTQVSVKGDKGDIGAQGIPGPQGIQGVPGTNAPLQIYAQAIEPIDPGIPFIWIETLANNKTRMWFSTGA